MVEEKNMRLAKQVYRSLCNSIDNRGWRFEKEEDKLLVYFGVNSENIPIQFVIMVDAERQLIRSMSALSFKMNEDKRLDGAIAACAASYNLVDGSFDYSIFDGTVIFRIIASFRDSIIGEGLFDYLVNCSVAMVEKYNDLFLSLDKGTITIEDFISKI